MWCSQRQPLVRGLAPWLACPSFESPCLTVAVVSVGRASFVSVVQPFQAGLCSARSPA